MLDHPARFLFVGTGTKVGKTIAFAQYAFERLCQGKRVAWCGPFYARTGTGFNYIADALAPLDRANLAKVDNGKLKARVFATTTGQIGELVCFSGDNPQAIYGDAFDDVIIDEATRQNEIVWNAFRTTVTATGGRIRCAFNMDVSPKQWAIREFLRAKAGLEPTYAAITMPTASSPYVPLAEVEQARRTLPDRVFAALYLAQIQDDGARVFIGHEECRTSRLRKPSGSATYLMGVDVARKHDFTVVIVMDVRTKDVVHFDRFHNLPWKAQVARIAEISTEYNSARVICDATGVGDAVVEMIQREGCAVEGVVFTNARKVEMVERLMVAFQRREIGLPVEGYADQLSHELDNFEFQPLPGGGLRYGAPEGYFDDCVCALMLVNDQLAASYAPMLPDHAATTGSPREVDSRILTAM